MFLLVFLCCRRFIHDFPIICPEGAIRVTPSSDSSRGQQGAVAAAQSAGQQGAAAAAAAAVQQGAAATAQQQEGFVQSFVVDSSSCQGGNPLAHLLCYRALAADWPCGMFDEQCSVQGGPNAVLLPVSDNTTGKVYVAVVALRGITVASGEDVCIDYGLPYWRSRRSLDRMLQASSKLNVDVYKQVPVIHWACVHLQWRMHARRYMALAAALPALRRSHHQHRSRLLRLYGSPTPMQNTRSIKGGGAPKKVTDTMTRKSKGGRTTHPPTPPHP